MLHQHPLGFCERDAWGRVVVWCSFIACGRIFTNPPHSPNAYDTQVTSTRPATPPPRTSTLKTLGLITTSVTQTLSLKYLSWERMQSSLAGRSGYVRVLKTLGLTTSVSDPNFLCPGNACKVRWQVAPDALPARHRRRGGAGDRDLAQAEEAKVRGRELSGVYCVLFIGGVLRGVGSCHNM